MLPIYFAISLITLNQWSW